MKKLIIPCAIIFLASCSLKSNSIDPGVADNHTSHQKIHPGRDTARLKWQLDTATRANIADIRKILSGSPKEEELVNYGKILKNKTAELLSECRMKGADHDALHAWLESFIHDVGLLEDGKNNQADWLKLRGDMQQFDKDFI
jgi:hypothetical protein